jgi:hypothetical protein
MAQPRPDRHSVEPGDAARDEADAVVVAERLRAEMHSAVDAVRAGLPRAFPRWERQRSQALRTASSERRQ